VREQRGFMNWRSSASWDVFANGSICSVTERKSVVRRSEQELADATAGHGAY
jgi:hypothetical protein